MKKIVLLIIACLCTINSNGEVVNVDGINYEINLIEKTAKVSKSPLFSGELVIPSSIIYNNVNYKVTGIGMSAFDCTNVQSVVISNGVTNIEAWAFRGCSNLVSIVIPPSINSMRMVNL